MENLLGNAWKYTGNNDETEIAFGTQQDEGELETVYFVRDNGVGFEMAEVDRLFGTFQRLQSGNGFEGNGIGLATVKRIIARHGGRIWAEGEPGKGATFFFTL
jgi:light-regulated signal transduction histidine kinase (bacteriophytochrome)